MLHERFHMRPSKLACLMEVSSRIIWISPIEELWWKAMLLLATRESVVAAAAIFLWSTFNFNTFISLRPEQNGCHFADNLFNCNSSSEKCYFHLFKFCSCLFLKVQLTTNQHSSNGLVPNKQQAITWINDDQFLQCHMMSLGQNELYSHDSS